MESAIDDVSNEIKIPKGWEEVGASDPSAVTMEYDKVWNNKTLKFEDADSMNEYVGNYIMVIRKKS